ncbi:MAG: ATP-binding protein [Lachnospiraceae bacterium]|nr:ATP-binding protein [Lachnospiraceae bacterium]
MRIIERKPYIERLVRLRGTPDIKIITGMRRSGKSELVRMYIRMLKKEDANVIYIDFGDLRYEDLKTYRALYDHVEAQYKENCENILVIDEVQLCEKFELAINSLHNSHKYDIYITGSNAFLLSSDLSTLFTGRYLEIPVFPFSFEEFCRYFEIDGLSDNALDDYVVRGGLSGSYVYKTEEDRVEYIKDVYDTIIKRDLVDKYRVNEVSLFDTLAEFLMDNVSNLTSANKISSILKQNNVETNHVTIGNYLKYLCNAFMFYKVKRYDIRGKKYLETSDKYYLGDLGLRYAILGSRNMDYGRAYENIVAIELLRREYSVYVGKLYEKEIDFVAMKQSQKIYIQVSDDISNSTTLERELAPLKSIRDSYPKILLANTKHRAYDIDGIQVQDISRWLLGANGVSDGE